MSMHYSDPERERNPHALPDVETFRAYMVYCLHCGLMQQGQAAPCGCNRICQHGELGWWYWHCLPGCLPDSDPIGPFDTEADALAHAREWMGE